jgi:hypothetical protein
MRSVGTDQSQLWGVWRIGKSFTTPPLVLKSTVCHRTAASQGKTWRVAPVAASRAFK